MHQKEKKSVFQKMDIIFLVFPKIEYKISDL